MEKHTINVPGVEEFARPRSRRDFFKALAVGSVGAAAGSVLLSRNASAQSGSDIDILNFALTLELLEATFYERALDAGVLSGDALAVVENLAKHENAHAEVLTAVIEGAGATPVAAPEFVFPAGAFSSTASILDLANTFEPVGVGAYIGAAPLIDDPVVLEVAGSIEGVEGEHVVAIRWLLGLVPFANEAFPEALTMDEVLAAVAPFIMGGMMDTGGAQYRDRSSFGRV